MLSPLMILSLDQGKLAPAPRSLGQFDARLLTDIAGCIAASKATLPAEPKAAGPIALIREKIRYWLMPPASSALRRPANLYRLKP
jgi:hypothetical protein